MTLQLRNPQVAQLQREISLKDAKELTEDEISRAFRYWRRKYGPFESEKYVTPLLNDQLSAPSGVQIVWLKTVRKSLFLSASTVAARLQVTRAAYAKLEVSEALGTIHIQALSKAAEAMDCELIYGIRAKNRKHFSEIIWSKLLPVARQHTWLRNCDVRKKSQALAFVADRLMNDSKFRKNVGWSQQRLK